MANYELHEFDPVKVFTGEINPLEVNSFMYEAYDTNTLGQIVIDKNNFAQCVDVYYEDLISDPYYLFSKLNIKKPIDLTLQVQSPYQNNKLIINIDQCHDWFEQLHSQEITQLEIDLYRNSVW